VVPTDRKPTESVVFWDSAVEDCQTGGCWEHRGETEEENGKNGITGLHRHRSLVPYAALSASNRSRSYILRNHPRSIVDRYTFGAFHYSISTGSPRRSKGHLKERGEEKERDRRQRDAGKRGIDQYIISKIWQG
jgi:hypothetical protein